MEQWQGKPRLQSRNRANIWFALRKSPGAMIGLVIVVLLLSMALFAAVITPQGIDDQDLMKGLLPPGDGFALGTDEFGRDLFSRIVYGARISLQVGIIATAISAAVGVTLGLIAGYYGGPADHIIQGMIDVSWAFPTVLMAIFLVATLGPGLINVMVAVGLVYWGGFARVVRGQVLSLREWEYINATRAIGAGRHADHPQTHSPQRSCTRDRDGDADDGRRDSDRGDAEFPRYGGPAAYA